MVGAFSTLKLENVAKTEDEAIFSSSALIWSSRLLVRSGDTSESETSSKSLGLFESMLFVSVESRSLERRLFGTGE